MRLQWLFKLAQFPHDPTAEPTNSEFIQVTPALTTYSIASQLSQAIPIAVGIGTHAEVDLVDIKLVQQLGLKPCRNTNLPILQAVNQQNLHTVTHHKFEPQANSTPKITVLPTF